VARLVERILVWVAGLVTVAAIVAVIINVAPGTFSGVPWLHLNQSANAAAIDLAEQAMARGDTRAALKLAARAVNENRSDSVVANRAGNVALRASDSKAAETYYLAGERADGRYPWNYVALGQLYERQGKVELADEQLRAATVAAPDQPFVHYDLGVVEMEERLYAAALSDFIAELKRSPAYKPAMIGRAEALEKMGRRGEAVALYNRAGVDATKRNTTRPKLNVTPVVQPSPTPLPSPPPTPKIALVKPSPRHVATKRVVARRAPTALAAATPTPGPVRPPWATEPPSPQASAVAVAPTSSAKPLSEVAADARSYLLDVAQDLDFTRSLPSSDPGQTTAALRFNLMDALAHKPVDIDSLLRIGTAALLSGRLTLATAAFNAASDAAPHDWRGPYFAGLTRQANGEMQLARSLFATSLAREARAETYTGIALIDLQDGNARAAAVNAHRAAEMNPSYEPGRFVAGMIDLIQADLRGAESNLAAAQALGGAPARTSYFLTELHDIVGASGVNGS
jgi:tetratricopeptide (TPR) repeat protein